MSKIIFFFLLGISTQLYAQKTDTTTYYVDLNLKPVSKGNAKIIFKTYQSNLGSWIFATYNLSNVIQQKETYSDSLLTINNGPYVEYKSGKPSLKGTFINNLKHGNFISYDTVGIIENIGFYNLDTLKSNTFYWANGNKREEKIYGKNNMIIHRSVFYENSNLAVREVFNSQSKVIESSYLSIEGLKVKYADIESPPLFPGGIDNFYRFLAKNIKYPEEVAEANIKGRVIISFTITETGDVMDVKIDKKLSPELDLEAVRVIKLSPKWIAGKFFGKFVKVRYNIPIEFNIRGGRYYN